MKHLIPTAVLRQYDFGKVRKITSISSGLIHQTFCVETDQGQYIMQRLHPILSSVQNGEDFCLVTNFLKQEGMCAPMCVRTKKGEALACEGKYVWRTQTKLPGRTRDVLESRTMAREAGKIYGQFHRVMSGMNDSFKSKPFLHQTEKIYAHFLHVIKKYEGSPRRKEVDHEIKIIQKELQKYFLPKDLPIRIIHGDPKISNILFDRSGKATEVIDLDTCNRGLILHELGDAFRSWCGKKEDDPRNTFSVPLFRSAWKGYQEGSQGLLTKKELSLVPKAIGTIILELACRFLTDYFEDHYFNWDEKRYTSRREHNLARMRGQLKEFVDYQKKTKRIKEIVSLG